ncbi:MAG: Hsp33 family molecular chaperone HslO [Sphingomonadales bacterium]|nr:Hsp33 family molecular chaperone HslO [Sphingomonadales bacterium]
MSTPPAIPEDETGFDRVLRFSIPARDVRGRVVRLGPVLEEILSAHPYPSGIRQLLAEALVLTALMGTLLKDDDSQMTLQAQTDGGAVELLVCDYRAGELRGYVRHDGSRVDSLGPHPSLKALFGDGFLAVTFDLATTGQRYQGIVPLEGEGLAQACQAYFERSEQIPTFIRTAVNVASSPFAAGGILLQHLPEGEEGRERLHVRMDHPEWEHVLALSTSTRGEELTDPALSLESLVWRLFHEEPEIRAAADAALVRGCRCSAAHYEAVLSRFPEAERAEMRDPDGLIRVECEFCSKAFPIRL